MKVKKKTKNKKNKNTKIQKKYKKKDIYGVRSQWRLGGIVVLIGIGFHSMMVIFDLYHWNELILIEGILHSAILTVLMSFILSFLIFQCYYVPIVTETVNELFNQGKGMICWMCKDRQILAKFTKTKSDNHKIMRRTIDKELQSILKDFAKMNTFAAHLIHEISIENLLGFIEYFQFLQLVLLSRVIKKKKK